METKKNGFKRLIRNDNDIFNKRVELMSESAKNAFQSMISKIKQDLLDKQFEIDGLMDLSPDTKYSLRPNDAGWNPKEWVTTYQELSQELYNLRIQLSIAEQNYENLFSEDCGEVLIIK